nr:RHS repeat-associated core domain-containing protein [uncultured Cellulosilyticum sp.]
MNYSQDRLNRVKNVQLDGKVFTYDYYADGTVKTVTSPVGSGQLVSSYSYDNMNRLKELRNTLNGTVISTYTYTYDAHSNIIKLVESEKLTNGKTRNRTSNYTYDKLDQLLTVNSTDGRNITYAYDSRGNRSITNAKSILETLEAESPLELSEEESEAVSNTENALETIETEHIEDATIQKSLDEVADEALVVEIAEEKETAAQEGSSESTEQVSVNTAEIEGQEEALAENIVPLSAVDLITDLSFNYNAFDELNQCQVGGKTYTYSYDAEGIRVAKASNQGTVKYYHNYNGEVIAETNETGQVTAQNIWTDRILARKVNSQYYYYVTNGHGDVTQIINEQGQIINTYKYDEWGNILDQVEGINNPIRYAGEYYDEESGLYYLRARYYAPSIGSFINHDERTY